MYKLLTSLALLVAVISANTFYSCTSKASAGNDTIRGLQVTVDIPLVDRDGSLIANKNFFDVYYLDDLVMYKFNFRYDSTYNGEIIKQERRSHYFVYQQGAARGYSYDPREPQNTGQQFSVDSMLQKSTLQNFQWHQVPQLTKAVFSGTDSGVLKEVYVGPDGYNKAYNDSVIFYYSGRFKPYSFSLSNILDSLRGQKLFKIRILYPEVYSEANKITFPRRETHFEMQEAAIDNRQEIARYFDNFRRDHLKR